MYRAPASSSGAPGYLMLILLVWGVLYLGGCTDTPSDLGFDLIPPMEDVEIEMATDPDLTAALIEDVSSSMSANMTAAASVEISTADSLFNQARAFADEDAASLGLASILEKRGLFDRRVPATDDR